MLFNVTRRKYAQNARRMKMEQLEGLRNFAVNLKPTMKQIEGRKKLLPSELQSILQFYLEVVDYLSGQANKI